MVRFILSAAECSALRTLRTYSGIFKNIWNWDCLTVCPPPHPYTLCQILSVLRLDNVPKLSTLRKNILSGFGVKSHLITPIESLNS